MSDCELIKTCIFFNNQMQNMPSSANLMKMVYCQGDSSKCARYVIFKEQGRDKVPPTLFPSKKISITS